MGLDISFDRQAALKAGLVVKQERRGSDEQILNAKDDPDYQWYLQRVVEYVLVPEINFWVETSGTDTIIVRANKWGRTYNPLTQWLKSNNILWDEF